jgi:hypothetical protein
VRPSRGRSPPVSGSGGSRRDEAFAGASLPNEAPALGLPNARIWRAECVASPQSPTARAPLLATGPCRPRTRTRALQSHTAGGVGPPVASARAATSSALLRARKRGTEWFRPCRWCDRAAGQTSATLPKGAHPDYPPASTGTPQHRATGAGTGSAASRGFGDAAERPPASSGFRPGRRRSGNRDDQTARLVRTDGRARNVSARRLSMRGGSLPSRRGR